MNTQSNLFQSLPKPPRAKARVMMHWDDAGHNGPGPMGNFFCKHCGYRAGWLGASELEMRRGIPCPECAPALFIPLKTGYFEDFKAGVKTVEYRKHGPRWNEQMCFIGRRVVLSKGYGKQHRLTGNVVGFYTTWRSTPDWLACYDAPGMAACICISLTSSEQP